MTLQEIVDTVANSSRDDWWHDACWGANSGPSYRDHLESYERYEGSSHIVVVKSHSDIAVYKPDVSITLAWGLTALDDFREDWANKWPDRKASSSFVDVFYNGALAYRDLYVTVDGGRTRLPIPRRKLDAEKERIVALTVPRGRYNFIRLVDSLDHLSSFEEYFQRAGFTVVDEPWP